MEKRVKKCLVQGKKYCYIIMSETLVGDAPSRFSYQINYMKYEEEGQGIDRKIACRIKQHAVIDEM